MQTVDEKPETIHVYVVREEEPKPSLLPIFLSAVALSILVVSSVLTPYQQPVARAVIRVQAVLLPLKTFTAQVAIIPTGIKTYPATNAHGVLTITNGSVISQTLPAGFTTVSNTGISVVTDRSVFVFAGSANGYGIATVPAHLLLSGINMSTLSVNQTLGTSLYIRNLSPFAGGRPAYSVKYVTAQDKLDALQRARTLLVTEADGLRYPCNESFVSAVVIKMTWRCIFVTYSVPSYMHVTGARLVGRNVIVSVLYTVRPMPGRWVK